MEIISAGICYALLDMWTLSGIIFQYIPPDACCFLDSSDATELLYYVLYLHTYICIHIEGTRRMLFRCCPPVSVVLDLFIFGLHLGYSFSYYTYPYMYCHIHTYVCIYISIYICTYRKAATEAMGTVF